MIGPDLSGILDQVIAAAGWPRDAEPKLLADRADAAVLMTMPRGAHVVHVYRSTPGHTLEARLRVQARVAEHGLAPRVLGLGASSLALPLGRGLHASVMEFAAGALVEPPTPQIFAEVGRFAARLQRVLGTTQRLEPEVVRALPQIDLRDALRDATETLETSTDAPEPLVSILARIEQLLTTGADDVPTLVHGDLFTGNLVRTPEGLVAIDFADVGIASQRHDVACVLANPLAPRFATACQALLAAYRAEMTPSNEEGWRAGLLVVAARMSCVLVDEWIRRHPSQTAFARHVDALHDVVTTYETGDDLVGWVNALADTRI